MTVILVGILIAVYTAHSLFAKLFSRYYPGEEEQTSGVYSVWYGLIVSVATFAVAGFSVKISYLTLIFGLVNAVAIVGYNTSLICASERGPYSVVMISSLFGGIIVPMVSSMLFFDGALTPLQWIAIAVVLVSFVFLNVEKRGEKPRDSIKPGFYLFCILQFVSNGAYGAILNAQSTLMQGSEDNGLIVVTYLGSFVLSLAILVVKRKKKALGDLKLNKKSALCLAVGTGSVTAGIMILMYCLSLMNVAVLYTAENGGVLLLSVIMSAIIFKEKITMLKAVGILLAVAGIVMLSIP